MVSDDQSIGPRVESELCAGIGDHDGREQILCELYRVSSVARSNQREESDRAELDQRFSVDLANLSTLEDLISMVSPMIQVSRPQWRSFELSEESDTSSPAR